MQQNITIMQKNVETTAYRKELRRRIMDLAMDLFRRRGIRQVKMDDIATALSVSKRTLYEIYENKEVLLYEGIVREHEAYRQELATYVEQQHPTVMDVLLLFYRNHVEEFGKACPDFFADLKRYPMVQDFFVKEEAHNKENARRFFLRGIEEGYFRDDVNYDIVTRVSEIGIKGTMESNMFSEYSLSEIFSNMIMTFFRGICTPKGLEILESYALTNAGKPSFR